MKLLIPAGTTSLISHVFIQDTSATDGSGKVGLVFGDMTARYVRAGGTITPMTMVDITALGTWDADVTDDVLGFRKVDDVELPGIYEIHFPNNILTAGANSVVIQLRAVGAAPCHIGIQLAGVDIAQVSNDAVAADNLELMFDGTGYAGGMSKLDVNIVSQEDIDFSDTQKGSLDAAEPVVTVGDKTGFLLDAAYDAAKTAAQPGDGMAVVDKTGFFLDAAEITAIQSGLATAENLAIVDGIVDAIKIKTDTLGGAGAISWTYTLTEEGTDLPIPDADIAVSTDAARVNIVASGKTDAHGEVEFMLDAGTYYFWRKKAGWNFLNPDTEDVA